MKADLLTRLRAARIIPVLTIHDVAHAVPLAEALVAGGLPVLEVTLRTPAALAAVATICRQVPTALVGLGTVTSPDDLAIAEDLGLSFAFSPGVSQTLLAAAARRDITFIPGIATASELMWALDYGVRTVKLFPAMASGGIAMLRALAGPFPTAAFCPTGGITPENSRDFLREQNVVAVGGTWLAPAAEQAAAAWDVIRARAIRAVELSR